MKLQLLAPKILHYFLKSSRRDTIIVNFQLSIVNSAKPFKQQFIVLLSRVCSGRVSKNPPAGRYNFLQNIYCHYGGNPL